MGSTRNKLLIYLSSILVFAIKTYHMALRDIKHLNTWREVSVGDQKTGPSTIRVMPTLARRQVPKACHEIAWDLLVPSTSWLVSLEFIFQPKPPAIISLLFKPCTTLYPLSFFCLKTTLPSHLLLLVRCSPFPPDHQIKRKVGSQRVSQIVCLRLRFCFYLHF